MRKALYAAITCAAAIGFARLTWGAVLRLLQSPRFLPTFQARPGEFEVAGWRNLSMRDPYDVLGVSKSAGAAEIKNAFRKLAKKLHPDANKHDTRAAARFAEVNAAYEILGDAAKRKAYDRGEIDAEGKPRFQGFEGFAAGARGGRQGGF